MSRKLRPTIWFLLAFWAVTVLAIRVWVLSQINPWQRIYATSSDAIVEVRSGSSGDAVTANLGTGFVFHRDDSVIILTNRHVALPGNAAQLVFKDGITAGAEVVNSSLDHDLAVLQPSGVRLANYESLERGDSADLAIGDEVMTIGHPIGESRHISIGFYTGRFTNEEGRTLLRLSMSVDPGNSGGPLLNRQGSVVGIVTLKHSTASNIAYAIPIEKAHNLDINP